jgi:hypothetical protein
MKAALSASIFFLLFATCTSNANLKFEKIEHETNIYKTRNSDSLSVIHEKYIVHYFSDNADNEKAIDEFVCHYMDTIQQTYQAYIITFYKHSSITNIESLSRRPDNISESLMNDYLWHYSFNKERQFKRKTKVKNFDNRKFFFETPECVTQ